MIKLLHGDCLELVAEDHVILYNFKIIKSFTDCCEIFGIDMKTMTALFFNSEDWARLKNKIKACFSYRKFKIEYLNDCVSAYAINLMEEKGQRQTVDQFVIDFLRKIRVLTNGGTGEKVFFVGENIETASASKSEELEYIGFYGTRKGFLELYSKWGLTAIEISAMFDLPTKSVKEIMDNGYTKKPEKLSKVNIKTKKDNDALRVKNKILML